MRKGDKETWLIFFHGEVSLELFLQSIGLFVALHSPAFSFETCRGRTKQNHRGSCMRSWFYSCILWRLLILIFKNVSYFTFMDLLGIFDIILNLLYNSVTTFIDFQWVSQLWQKSDQMKKIIQISPTINISDRGLLHSSPPFP